MQSLTATPTRKFKARPKQLCPDIEIILINLISVVQPLRLPLTSLLSIKHQCLLSAFDCLTAIRFKLSIWDVPWIIKREKSKVWFIDSLPKQRDMPPNLKGAQVSEDYFVCLYHDANQLAARLLAGSCLYDPIRQIKGFHAQT